MDDFTLNVWTKHRPIPHLFLNLPLILFGAFWATDMDIESSVIAGSTMCYLIGAIFLLRFIFLLIGWMNNSNRSGDYDSLSVPDALSAVMLIVMGIMISCASENDYAVITEGYLALATVMGIFLTVDSVVYTVHYIIVKRNDPSSHSLDDIIGGIVLSLLYLAGVILAIAVQSNPESGIDLQFVTFFIYVAGMFLGGIFSCITAVGDYVRMHAHKEGYVYSERTMYAIKYHRKRLPNVIYAVITCVFGVLMLLLPETFVFIWTGIAIPFALAALGMVILMAYKFAWGESFEVDAKVCLADIISGLLLIVGLVFCMTYGLGAKAGDVSDFWREQIPISMCIFMGYFLVYAVNQLIGLGSGAKKGLLYRGGGWTRRFIYYILLTLLSAGLIVGILVLKGQEASYGLMMASAAVMVVGAIVNAVSTFIRWNEVDV